MLRRIDRRSFLVRTGAAVCAAALFPRGTSAAALVDGQPVAEVPSALDSFAQAYLKSMHGPGMTMGLISGEQSSIHAYGYEDLEGKVALNATRPFWIGSICKSFVGIVAMQLRDEGKLDLQKPVHEIMPELPFTEEFGKITTHHLLTHTSGLPNWLQLFSSDPAQKAQQAYAPGTKFAYCNLGFDALGLLIGHLDGRSWPESVRDRIFRPLRMTESSGRIDDEIEARMPTGYHFQYRDRPCTVADPLVPVGYVTMSNAAGSIAAPSADMCKYMRMLLERGRGPSGRIVSEEGFKLFSTPYVKAPVLSADASYGYGIGVETIADRTMLRHTGGATAFASSILVDLDGGVGAFASINAMQGYRPNPVTRFGVDLLYATKSGGSPPPSPAIEDPLTIKTPEEFVGRYQSVAGEVLTVARNDRGLAVTTSLGTTELRPLGGDLFSASDDAVLSKGGRRGAPSAFALVFERERPNTKAPGAVVALGYGSRRFAGQRAGAVAVSAGVKAAGRYTGVYTNDSPWLATVKVVERNGALWLDGTDEMHLTGGDRFSVEGAEGTLELSFVSFLDGCAQGLQMDGEMLRRVALPTEI